MFKESRNVGRGGSHAEVASIYQICARNTAFMRAYPVIPHCVLVNNAIAVTSGWEIYGFAKELGAFTFSEQPFAVKVETLAVEHYSPEAERLPLPVIEIQTPSEAGHHHSGSEAWTSQGLLDTK